VASSQESMSRIKGNKHDETMEVILDGVTEDLVLGSDLSS
jgi:hypothetical protein